MDHFIAARRLYLNAERDRIVHEGAIEAATLYAAEGDEIPPDAVERFGLKPGVDLVAEAAQPPAEHADATPAEKMAEPTANKARK